MKSAVQVEQIEGEIASKLSQVQELNAINTRNNLEKQKLLEEIKKLSIKAYK